MHHSKRHDCNIFEVDPLWYTQPVKRSESVCGVVLVGPVLVTLRAKLSGAVYCNRSCLCVCNGRAGGVGLLPR